jgi:hypothetical protein
MIPDPLKDWYADDSKQIALDQAMRQPIMQEAMALLQRICLPKTNFNDRASAEAIAHSSMEQCRTAGFFSYPDELWQLTEKPAAPPVRPEGYSEGYVKEWAKRRGYLEDSSEAAEQ